MNAQDFRSLQEAYMEVVENQQLDEISASTGLSAAKKADEVAGQLATLGGRPEDVAKKRKQAQRLYTLQAKKRTTRVSLAKEEVDIYDIILSHLLDEGYAETLQSAEAIMVNMSEDWREDIMEGMTMKDFKSNRRKLQRKEVSADAEKRGHVGKEWHNTGRKYSSDEAKSGRAKMSDYNRQQKYQTAEDPDSDNADTYPASKTKNPKKLRKQKAMGELG